MRRAQAGQGGDEVDTFVAVERCGELLAFARDSDDAEPIAKPLERRAGDEDRALERVDRLLVAEFPGHRAHEALGRRSRVSSCVHEDEAPRSVRRFGLPGREARLPEERRLLVARDASDRHASTEEVRLSENPAR